MQITSRFTVAIHTMLCIAHFHETRKVTSNFIALSTNSNPVIIRKILGQLKAAELVEVKSGVGGASLTKPLEQTTLLDIFYAVEAVGDEFFHFHENPNCECPVGKNFHSVLNGHLTKIQEVMNEQMRQTTLKILMDEMDLG